MLFRSKVHLVGRQSKDVRKEDRKEKIEVLLRVVSFLIRKEVLAILVVY